MDALSIPLGPMPSPQQLNRLDDRDKTNVVPRIPTERPPAEGVTKRVIASAWRFWFLVFRLEQRTFSYTARRFAPVRHPVMILVRRYLAEEARREIRSPLTKRCRHAA